MINNTKTPSYNIDTNNGAVSQSGSLVTKIKGLNKNNQVTGTFVATDGGDGIVIQDEKIIFIKEANFTTDPNAEGTNAVYQLIPGVDSVELNAVQKYIDLTLDPANKERVTEITFNNQTGGRVRISTSDAVSTQGVQDIVIENTEGVTLLPTLGIGGTYLWLVKSSDRVVVNISSKEDLSNKQNDLTPSTTKYPTVDAVLAGLDSVIVTANNGLTKTGDTIGIDGTLIRNSEVSFRAFTLQFIKKNTGINRLLNFIDERIVGTNEPTWNLASDNRGESATWQSGKNLVRATDKVTNRHGGIGTTVGTQASNANASVYNGDRQDREATDGVLFSAINEAEFSFSVTAGVITAVTVVKAGSFFANFDFTPTGATSGTLIRAVVTAVGGIVTSIIILNGGTGNPTLANYKVAGVGTACQGIITESTTAGGSSGDHFFARNSLAGMNPSVKAWRVDPIGRVLQILHIFGTTAYGVRVLNDAQNRFNILSNGVLQFGDGAVATFLNLYKPNGIDALKTDDKLVVGINGTSHSTLNVGGSVSYKTISISADTALNNTHHTVFVAGTTTVTLPTAVGIIGREYRIKNIGGNVVTVVTTGGEFFDATAGFTSRVLSSTPIKESITVISTNVGWVII